MTRRSWCATGPGPATRGRPQIAAGLFISLDGAVEAAGKWTGPYDDDQVGAAVGALMAVNDAMLPGRLDLLLFPVVIGSGQRLFSETDGQQSLILTASESFGTGVVRLSYELAG